MWGDWTRSWKSMRDQNTKLTCIKWFVLSPSNSKIYNPRKRRLMSWKQGYTHIYVYTSISEWDMGKRNFNIPKDGFKNNLQLTPTDSTHPWYSSWANSTYLHSQPTRLELKLYWQLQLPFLQKWRSWNWNHKGQKF